MRRTQSALALAGLLALVGGGTALASKGTGASTATATTPPAHPFRGGGPHRPGEDLQAAATYLGTTTTKLVTQLQARKTLAQIAAATSGKSTAGLIAALVADAKQRLGSKAPPDLEQHITDLVNGVHPDHGPGGPGPLEAAATYLATSQSALDTQLRAGKTLAQVANATSGKSSAGLIAALVADAKQHFGSNVPSDVEEHITDLVNGVRAQAPSETETRPR